MLTEEVPFDIIRHFGMQSGRDADKFKACKEADSASNKIKYINKYTNAYFSVKVEKSLDLGSHEMFIGEVTESKVLSPAPSCTYAFYHSDIKPKIQSLDEKP